MRLIVQFIGVAQVEGMYYKCQGTTTTETKVLRKVIGIRSQYYLEGKKRFLLS